MTSLFVSYSHDSQEHKKWVLELTTYLRENGVDASLDQWDLRPGDDVSMFMQRGITESDRVILVCSENYVSKAEGGTGGVGYERLIVTEEIVRTIDTKKYIPIVRNNMGAHKIPRFLGPRLYIDFSDNATVAAKRQELLRELLGAPTTTKPLLGENPFSGSVAAVAAARVMSPTGINRGSGTPVLDDKWFSDHNTASSGGIATLQLSGHMELRFAIHENINASQVTLLEAVQKSEIKTFGWPIAVILANKDGHRPRPYQDGIRAEVVFPETSTLGRTSYDYWALKANGDFYLLQSLFEDSRDQNALFFNTRIVRVAEGLLFAANLYKNLGVPDSVFLSFRVTHSGLAGRKLKGVGSRVLSDKQASVENTSQNEITTELSLIQSDLPALVEKLTAPMFALFNFQQFNRAIYEDITRRFEKGEVS